MRRFGHLTGHQVSAEVLGVQYYNMGSVQGTPYTHEFRRNGVELWALSDGSILLRHPSETLWNLYDVRDDE